MRVRRRRGKERRPGGQDRRLGAHADKLAAYFAIVPRVSQSNETDHRGRITKRGNKLARTTLVQSKLIAIRYSGYLSAFYRRIKERRGAGKAIIATARKLLKISVPESRLFKLPEFLVHESPTVAKISLRNCRFSLESGASGERTMSSMRPCIASAALTGTGLLSINIALANE